jgi:hypothetical protein
MEMQASCPVIGLDIKFGVVLLDETHYRAKIKMVYHKMNVAV